MLKFLPHTAVFVALVCGVGCKEDANDVDAIGLSISNPVDVKAHSAGTHFYVLNADFDHAYKTGSVLILDHNGNKKGSIEIPRLGRNITIAGNDMVVTFDRESDDADSKTRLYDISNPESPQQKKEWLLGGCSPINATMHEGYPYFAVSCLTGSLYMGELKSTREESTLTRVRDFPGFVRRALHIDAKRGLLYAFVTDMDAPTLYDSILPDKQTWSEKADGTPFQVSNDGNDFPDIYESDRGMRRLIKENTSPFQFVVYDIDAESKAGFPLRKMAEVRHELRWMSFNLKNFDGTEDISLEAGRRYYRTNFWQARSVPGDDDAFYVSHRGLTEVNRSEHANSVIKISIKGDPHAALQTDKTYKVPMTDTFFEAERVYGFKGKQNDPADYVSDFAVGKLSGVDIVAVNSFRDLANFRAPRYAVSFATLNDPPWTTNTVSTSNVENSYLQIALNNDGTLLTCSHYSNKIIQFNLVLGSELGSGTVIQ